MFSIYVMMCLLFALALIRHANALIFLMRIQTHDIWHRFSTPTQDGVCECNGVLVVASSDDNGTIVAICDQHIEHLLRSTNNCMSTQQQWQQFMESVSFDLHLNPNLLNSCYVNTFFDYTCDNIEYTKGYSKNDDLSLLPCASNGKFKLSFVDKAHTAFIQDAHGVDVHECTAALYKFAGPDHDFHKSCTSVAAFILFCHVSSNNQLEINDAHALKVTKRSGASVMLNMGDNISEYITGPIVRK